MDDWYRPSIQIAHKDPDEGVLDAMGEYDAGMFDAVPQVGDILLGICDAMPSMRVVRRFFVKGPYISWWWLEVEVPAVHETGEILALNAEVRSVYAELDAEKAAEVWAAFRATAEKKPRRGRQR